MKINRFLPVAACMVFLFCACKKEAFFGGEHDPEVIKNYRNQSASVSKMDSVASVNFITKQKLLEVYELSVLNYSNQNDSILGEVLHSQLAGYFLETDTVNIPKLMSEIDSLKARFVEIRHSDGVENDTLTENSLMKINYWVKYYSANKKLIDSLPKTAEFILKKEPKKFKHEFTFYFTDLNLPQTPKDTIESPVTQ
ncbi:MAG: hypothetical protein WCY25_01925 [Moheibacter sp.]